MYQIAYGTNSPTQSARAIQRAVEISIAQLLPVLWSLDASGGPDRERGPYSKNFGVGIRARMRSSSSTVTRSRPLLRHDSSTDLITIPLTNAGGHFNVRTTMVYTHVLNCGPLGGAALSIASEALGQSGWPRDLAASYTRRVFGTTCDIVDIQRG
jgi:hypothetical protein